MGSWDGSEQHVSVNMILPLLLALSGTPSFVGFSCGCQIRAVRVTFSPPAIFPAPVGTVAGAECKQGLTFRLT